MHKVMISQSNYIPWKGFFDAINIVDTYVVYDEVQYTRRDWRNRNKIKTPQGTIWLTIPVDVKGKYTQKINETKITNPKWCAEHWATISHNYKRAPFYEEFSPYMASLYKEAEKFEYLTQVNIHFLKAFCNIIGIKTPFIISNDITSQYGKSERIVGICKELNAKMYCSGPTAKAYLKENLFQEESIEVSYFDFSGYPEYQQLYPPFEHAVSIIDVLFMTGPDISKYTLKNESERVRAIEVNI